MQFSKKVSQLSREYNIDPKDVLFAMLTTSGASVAESFAVIFRPAATTNAGLSSKASQYIGQRPGLRTLIDELSRDPETDQPKTKAGRPRKQQTEEAEDDTPILDYTDKDAVLKWLAIKAERAEKESTQIAAINAISNLQRMKQEAAVEDEKRVTFYIPLSYDRCEELREYLSQYFAEKNGNSSS
ncbi:MAG: hypothetical protein HDS16_05340 [Bacteroides sp.]|nr:hypothetical protein [Bacteroides sp.]